MILRDYQQAAVTQGQDDLAVHGSGLIVMATGLGKTVTAVHLADKVAEKKILWLAHRDLLVQQANDCWVKCTDRDVGIEMASFMSHRSNEVIIASVQTMIHRLGKFSPYDFDIVVVDESHHVVTKSFLTVIRHFQQNPQLSVLGMTATPKRADKRALGKVFNSVICDHNIKFGIDNGWLVPPKVKEVHIDSMDLSGVESVAGDLHKRQLSEVLEGADVLHSMAIPMKPLVGSRQGILYARSVRQAMLLVETLNYYGIRSSLLTGKVKDDARQEVMQQYKDGEIQFIVNVGVMTEGVDVPHCEVIAMGRPTKSTILFQQCLGRGLRPLPGTVDGLETAEERKKAIAESDKPHMLLVDFTGNAGKHDIAHSGDILGGDFSDPMRKKAYREAAESATEPMTIEELNERAEEILESRRQDERLESERREVLAMQKARVEYHVEEIDLFDRWDVKTWKNEKLKYKMIPPTANMIRALHGLGIERTDNLSRGAAGKLLGVLGERRKHKLATYKQMKKLSEFGVDAEPLTKDQATELIQEVIANNWRRPKDWKMTTAPETRNAGEYTPHELIG